MIRHTVAAVTSDDPDPEDGIDADFTVAFRHRLRFTRDVLHDAADTRTLADLFQAAPGTRARVLPVVDAGLLASRPDLPARLEACLDVAWCGPVVVPGGEACKRDTRAADAVSDAIDRCGLDRRSYVLVAGGGAVLDAAGYAAATAHRGVRLVRLPTTTLAQADSGVGVKNAVNRYGKKNWQGTFAVPWGVVNDEALLAGLGGRDFRGGFSEVVKVTLLKDADGFETVCRDALRIAGRDPDACRRAVRAAAVWHLRHITAGGDPFETREARPLDFGHWSAHRLEAMTDFALPHGEAVAIGLAIDCIYSHHAHGLPPDDLRRILRCLRELQLPTSHPALSRIDDLLAGLEEFRQHLGGRLTVTMLAAPGRPIDVHDIDAGLMRRSIREAVDATYNAPV